MTDRRQTVLVQSIPPPTPCTTCVRRFALSCATWGGKVMGQAIAHSKGVGMVSVLTEGQGTASVAV